LDVPDVYRCRQARFARPGGGEEAIDWSGCDTVRLADTATGLPPREETQVRCCWSAERFYVRFVCRNSHTVADFVSRDDPLDEQDVVELFIDEDRAGVREFQAWRPTGKINFRIPSRFGAIVLA